MLDQWGNYLDDPSPKYNADDGGGSYSGGTGVHIDPRTGKIDATYHPPANASGGSGNGVGPGLGGSGGTAPAAAATAPAATTGVASTAAAATPWYANYSNWLQAAGLGLAAYQTYRNSQPPKFKDPGLTPEQKRLSDLYFQSLTNPAMTNNASHVTDVSNSILDGYMKSNDGAGLQWTPPQTFSGQNGGAPIRQAWPGAPGGMAGAGAGMPSTPSANANSSAPSDPHAVIMNERDPHVQQLAMWIVVNNPTLPPDRALEQARAIVLHSSSSSASMSAPSARA